MDLKQDEETLREACNYGDMEALLSLFNKGVNLNSRNSINGWSALHWACKRGQVEAVKFLLSHGANPNILNYRNETPDVLAYKEEIIALIKNATTPPVHFSGPNSCGSDSSDGPTSLSQPQSFSNFHDDQDLLFGSNDLPFVNGLNTCQTPSKPRSLQSCSTQTSPRSFKKDVETSSVDLEKSYKELTIKVRVADTSDADFIEVDIPSCELSYSYLLTTCSRELAINPQFIERVRKLPDTRLRNDRDVRRLPNMSELELVVKGMTSRAPTGETQTSNAKSITSFKNQTILY